MNKAYRKMKRQNGMIQELLGRHTMEIKAYANAMKFRKRFMVAIAVLLGRW